jgi:hypothetical protein
VVSAALTNLLHGLEEADLSDIIAGRPEAEALTALGIISQVRPSVCPSVCLYVCLADWLCRQIYVPGACSVFEPSGQLSACLPAWSSILPPSGRRSVCLESSEC